MADNYVLIAVCILLTHIPEFLTKPPEVSSDSIHWPQESILLHNLKRDNGPNQVLSENLDTIISEDYYDDNTYIIQQIGMDYKSYNKKDTKEPLISLAYYSGL